MVGVDGKSDGKMTVEEAGRIGGEKVKAQRGAGFYSEIGKKGGIARKAQGADYRELGRKGGEARKQQGADYRELGRKGGETVKLRHGPEFYSQIGKKGGEARSNDDSPRRDAPVS